MGQVRNCYGFYNFKNLVVHHDRIVIAAGGGTEARAALRYGSCSGSTKMMRLLAPPAPQHWYIYCILHITVDMLPEHTQTLN
jgi:hypothetical protein